MRQCKTYSGWSESHYTDYYWLENNGDKWESEQCHFDKDPAKQETW